ncbi:MAG: YceI family protein [Bacteroidota bacterium]|nr:YceI family protein [Bacteroidota bacterium]
MKKIILLAVTITLSSFAIGQNKKEDYKINNETSTIEWTGKKVTGQHTGNISLLESALEVKDGAIEGGKITFDMTSITCTDMKGEMSDKLIGHLKSDDFFSVEKFNTATYKIKSVKPIKGAKDGQASHTITGDLTIKGITNEVSFPAIISKKENNIVAIGEAVVDRSKYDVRYGSPSFFENIGDKAIYDDFIIKFKLAASNK